ncbi:MAG TPA: GNAT family N-acetyltransferase [Ilumatobacteraceae bacterium]|nr:GNAT family N-acetyltransferase [Ilumatobacteraceae bacterium]
MSQFREAAWCGTLARLAAIDHPESGASLARLRQDGSVIVRGSDDRELFGRAVRRFRGVESSGRFLDAAGTVSFLAIDDDGDVVGWCWGQHIERPDDTSMLYLHELDVAEEHRREGFGTALVGVFLDEGRRLGASKAFLTTGSENAPARALYERLGFGLAEQGPTENYWIQLRPIGPTD